MANNVLFACERSAGHIFPALALAGKLKNQDNNFFESRIFLFATNERLKSYASQEGFSVVGKSFKRRNLIFESLWRGFEALFLIIRIRPRLVIGFGGRDSFFIVFFSALIGIKTAIYEPNVSFGKANKVLSLSQ